MTRQWPPYEMMESALVDKAQSRLDKLERLYHVGQNNIWDGREVLDALIKKHGPPRLPADKKESALKVLSILLWGELAAWAISADLAERIDDVEAKMAATSQAHDEARHFYVLRDYLRALGEPVPHLGGIGRRLLLSILETPSLVHKLIGMQLLTESNALAIFRGLVESKHRAGAGGAPARTTRRTKRATSASASCTCRACCSRLSRRRDRGRRRLPAALDRDADVGRPQHARPLPQRSASIRAAWPSTRSSCKTTSRATCSPTRPHGNGTRRRDAVRGLLNPAQGYGPKILDFIHPRGGIDSRPAWHRTALTRLEARRRRRRPRAGLIRRARGYSIGSSSINDQ